jgi:hypothetical protein
MALPDMSTDWATALSKFMAKEAAPAPEGWVTAEQAAKLWKVSRVYANRMLTRMIRSGAVERKRYAVQIQPKEGRADVAGVLAQPATLSPAKNG